MQADLDLRAYHYDLPGENIAQFPADRRDQARLLVLNRSTGAIDHLRFGDIDRLLAPGDTLVANDTRVFPARLSGYKESGGKAEVFLLGYPAPAAQQSGVSAPRTFSCEALIKSSRRPQPGSTISIGTTCHCTVLEDRGRGKWLIRLVIDDAARLDLDDLLAASGDIPLPPYILRPKGATPEDGARYQTVYADRPGAVAAPTAGLHFTDELLSRLRAAGIGFSAITLHVGYGTFAPVQAENIADHIIHREYIEVCEAAARTVNETRKRGGKVWAVGTTTVRALEYAAGRDGVVRPQSGWCDLYITPGYRFRTVDNLITNFHLPQSSLMFLVAALCGRERLLACYREAISAGYRFYSYGDAMAITT